MDVIKRRRIYGAEQMLVMGHDGREHWIATDGGWCWTCGMAILTAR